MPDTPMRTVHLTNYYHKTSGGISTAYNHLLEAANRRGQYVALIVPGDDDEIAQIGRFGKIHFVKAKNFPFIDKRYRMILPQAYLPSGSDIRKILLAEKPDLIEVCDKYTINWIGAMIRLGKFRELGRPILVHMSCERMDDNVRAFVSRGRLSGLLTRAFMRDLVYPLYDFYTANSLYTLNELRSAVGKAMESQDLSGLDKLLWKRFRGSRQPFSQRAYVHEPGVDSTTFHPERSTPEKRRRLLSRLSLGPEDRILLYAGRLSSEKNTEILPKILMKLREACPNYKFVIAGDGPQRKKLENEFSDIARDAVRFEGHLTDKNELADLYANCDVFVHPNPSEPFGIGPLEAMASGTAVVAPAKGGIMSYCSEENSWLVRDGVEGFASEISKVFDLPQDRRQRTSRARRPAEERSWENSTDRILDNFQTMSLYFKEHKMADQRDAFFSQ